MPCLLRTSYPHSKPQTPQRPHSTLVADAYAALLSSDFPHSHPFISASHHILNGVGDMTHGYGTSLFTFYTLTLPLPVFTPPPPLGAWQTAQSSYTHWGHGRPHSLLTPTGGMANNTVFLHPLGAWQTSLHTPTGGMAPHTVFTTPLGAWQTSLHTPTGGMAD